MGYSRSSICNWERGEQEPSNIAVGECLEALGYTRLKIYMESGMSSVTHKELKCLLKVWGDLYKRQYNQIGGCSLRMQRVKYYVLVLAQILHLNLKYLDPLK